MTAKADKTELTELSEEVSGLSERIENLPSAESDVFKAIYGKTTYEEIRAAYDSGKVVHCDYLDYCYILSRILSTAAYFDAMSAPNSFRIVCDNNGWTNTTSLLELRSNKVTSLSDKSTDTQYTSAKAVYDAIQNIEGDVSSDLENLTSTVNTLKDTTVPGIASRVSTIEGMIEADGSADTKLNK